MNDIRHGIDISHHQGNIDLSKIKCDFVICKASEGVSYKDSKMPEYYSKIKGIKGLYHFANGKSTGVKEANFFLGVIGDRAKEAMLVLDWEASAIKKGPAYAKAFLDRVKEATGVTPYIYMSASVTREFDWSAVAKDYPLWVAQYGSDKQTGYQTNPWKDKKGLGAWSHESIRQYTSNGKLDGYAGRLDLDIMYDEPITGKTKTKKKTSNKKTIDQVAKEVIAGIWGDGTTRKNRLTKAGYDYNAVQKKVNEILKKG